MIIFSDFHHSTTVTSKRHHKNTCLHVEESKQNNDAIFKIDSIDPIDYYLLHRIATYIYINTLIFLLLLLTIF